ncbi:hypothetical protein ACFPM3_20315 [Streptomyces coeruleoprunus]|uniref:Uncharacterized protein n=1 Tax=Streptomyces coeruleoprunus TaxID=285563 RepID=A0ABV9XHL5_9ACTN
MTEIPMNEQSEQEGLPFYSDDEHQLTPEDLDGVLLPGEDD